jgi:hypothetical protein
MSSSNKIYLLRDFAARVYLPGREGGGVEPERKGRGNFCNFKGPEHFKITSKNSIV